MKRAYRCIYIHIKTILKNMELSVNIVASKIFNDRKNAQKALINKLSKICNQKNLLIDASIYFF